MMYHARMRLFIGGRSAVEYWLLRTLSAPSDSRSVEPVRRRALDCGLSLARIKVLNDSAPKDAQVAEFMRGPLCGLSRPVGVMVAQKAAKSDTALKRCLLWSRDVPAGSFVRVDPGLYVATPEFAYLQMSRGLPFAGKLAMAYEFCANYARSIRDVRGFVGCPPLSSRALLVAFLQQASASSRSNEALVQVLGSVADGSASPSETLVAAQLFASRARGGFGVPMGDLNGEVEIPAEKGSRRGVRTYRCDVLWRDRGLALEYDSDAFHTGADRIAHDSARRNALLDLGYSVVTVTSKQLYDAGSFAGIGAEVLKLLGCRVDDQRHGYDWQARYGELRSQLLGARWQWETGI